ncbi:MAG: D-tyrosyl-tRNA(Tyr) deacylase [Planctomycetes bacterium]|nr:D-tyrosyl-tRNA(Tyr) deacylase [Planctomycetota bacterium]
MKAVIQRVRSAAVHVDGAVHSRIARGLLLFLGVECGDGEPELDALSKKVAGLRIFEDAAGKMNLSNEEVAGEYLVVSQFTLCADLAKGKRPGFERAMRPPEAEQLYERFCARLAERTGLPVRQGKFGATMQVELVNDGPATFLLDYPPPVNP